MPRTRGMTATVDDSRALSRKSIQKLLDYCRANAWNGYDPYDGLNSPLSGLLPSNRLFRTALIEAVKRSPVNLRPLLGIRKGLNPKGVALAARALTLLSRAVYSEIPESRSRAGSDALLTRETD